MNSVIESNKLLCEICDTESIGFNFGVRTCMACKAFFRRNAVRLGTYEFICSKDGHCTITKSQHPMCKCCRLAKCFRVGMKKELILTNNEKEQRRMLIEHNRQKRKLKDEKAKKLTIIPSIPKRSTYLSNDDDQILLNIFHAYENHCRNQKTYPIIKHSHTALHSFFNEYSPVHQSLIIFLKNIPQFNQISIDDRVRLLRNSFGFINIIHATAVRNEVPTSLAESLSNVYTSSITIQLFQCIERIQMLAHDMIIIRLLLLIITFSSGSLRNRNDIEFNDICTDSLSIFATQNRFVELLWKYILTKSSDEIQAVKFFSKLIQFLMYLLNVHIIVDGYINSFPQEIERMDALMQSMWPSPHKNTLNFK